jgi:hypothetical protein
MSIKKYFDVASSIKSLAGTTAEKISSQVESPGFHEQDIIKGERYIPQADYSVPQGFARYGNAEDYYTQAVRRIYQTFPYDGSLQERLVWENESTYLDLYIYNNEYPRTTGYINFAAGGWGTPSALTANGYGIPASSTNYEYIFVKGGPNQNPNGDTPYRAQFTGSNYYEPSKNRGSNLALNVNSKGISLEFWMKKDAFNDTKTQKEVIFDLWNGVTSSATNYARLRLELTSATGRRGGLARGESPFLLTLYSGSTGFFQKTIATPTITTTGSVADKKWHHYALTLKQDSSTVTTRFYRDGNLNKEQHLSASGKGTLQNISGKNLRANVGALITQPSRRSSKPTTAVAYAGKLSASLDEFRFWKAQRTSQEIGRFWFTQVGGGVNTDPEPFIETEVSANLDLGVYFKFNEGITTTASVDSTVLDYSGRFSNGAWTCPAISAGNVSLARNTGSAIVISKAATSEYKDPIIYEKHASVGSLLSRLQATGSSYDVNNNASIYNTMPSWIIQEDADGDGELRKMTQIIASYFDTLHLQIKDINSLKDVSYVSGSNKPLPFAEKLLSNYGLVAPEIFLDADILNTLASRSEDKVFEKSLEETKNIIYKNIYNNLVYIFKSKGTEKAFRNLIRCFGIDDELVKLNMYANNVGFELRNNRRNVSVADRFINFNTGDNKSAVVYNYRDPSNSQSAGYISGSSALKDGHAITLESEILFPLKSSPADDVYVDTNTVSSSLFGLHGVQAVHAASSPNHTTWAAQDIVNFQVYAVRDEATSDNVRFVVTSSSPRGKVPYLTSELYEDVYNNTRWNLAVRIKPAKYPLTSLVQGTELDPSRLTGSYTIELHGVQADAGEFLEEFTVSKTISAPITFITSSRRVYVGAHRTNFTGSLLSYSDVKVNACRFWLDYVEDEALNAHILDTENFGITHPQWYAYPFKPSSSYGDVTKLDSLVFNWEFLTNTGSNAAGQFTVPDLTSGSLISSTNPLTASFGGLGKILNPQYPALGNLFPASSTSPIDKDFVISSKLNLPETLQSEEMVKVLSAQDQDVFTPDSRPTNYSFFFEKSMYQVISEEMINYFATLKDFHNLIGDPVNQWRPEYKSIDFLRHKFFENVENKELDFDKFYEYYKWFDSTLSTLLAQIAPASADVGENIRTVIENHILERPKYQRKFPFLAKSDTNYPTGRINGDMTADKTAQASPDEFPAGTSFFTNTAFTRRQIGSSNTPQGRPWKHFHAPLSKVVENLSPGKSLLFDGADEYMNIGTAATWDTLIGGAGAAAKAFSFSFWAKPTAFDDPAPGFITFGHQDRGLMFLAGGSGPANSRVMAFLETGTSFGAVATAGQVAIDTWQHFTATYPGGTSGTTKIYINGSEASYDSQPLGAPSLIETADCVIGAGTINAGTTKCLAGNMCDVAVWDKELSAAEVTEIYGSGTRIKLTTTSCQSNLLSWWMMGNGGGDSATGTIFDQKSTRNGTPVNMETADLEEDSPSFKIPYGYILGTPANKNMYWHRYMELSALTGSKLTSRSKLYQSISQSFYRRTNSPVKFGVEGTTAVAGVGKHHNSVVNYVFSAARAWGNLGGRVTGKGRPVLNKLVSSGSSVEQLIPTTDVYYPSLKQRLGFGLSSSNGVAVSGPRHAPFSLYSSSVTTGYNAQVVKNYASGVMVTNLHNDFVIDTDIPMQGPFTEKYVGGRFYRHTALNKGTDTNQTRGEGFRIEFDNPGLGDNVLGVAKKSLVILPPNSRTGSSDPDMSAPAMDPVHWPTAYRFRDVAAKRPVNIKNIQMRTGSTIIGNYEKNYQVVNSNSRMKNDPFFNDQSFNFALYPETLATRGRFPLFTPFPWASSATRLNGNAFYQGKHASVSSSAAVFTSGSFSTSFWMKPTAAIFSKDNQVIVNLGRVSTGGAGPHLFDCFQMRLYGTGAPKIYANFSAAGSGATTYMISNTDLSSSANTWIHVVCVFPAASMDSGAGSIYPTVYINGAVDNSINKGNSAEFGTNFNTSASAPALQIGQGIYTGSVGRFLGDLCDVSLWNGHLSASHVTTLYNGGVRSNVYQLAAGEGGTIPGLVVNYKGGDGSSDFAGATDDWFGVVPRGRNLGPRTTFAAAAAYAVSDPANAPTKVPSKPLTAVDSLNPFRGNPLYKDTANTGGNLNFLVPMRTGSDSQDTIIVNRYAGSGYEVMSLGYMDPAHTEMSVYNALPYHNLAIIDYGLSGNVPVDPLAAKTITVVDQIDKNRGLDQRATLHCGPFGSDAAYGSVPELTYVTTPSWGKTNRNRKRRMYSHATKGEYYTASVYDNLYVQHQIPQSPQQYAWVTASVIASAGNAPMAFAPPGVLSGTVLSQLASGSNFSYYGNIYRNNFAGFSGRMIAPVLDLGARTTREPDAGLYSAYWNGTSTALNMGTYTIWDALIGASGVSAKAFSVSTWMYIGTQTDNEYNTMWSFGKADRYLLYVNSSGYQYFKFGIDDTGGGLPGGGAIRTNFYVAPPGEWLHVVCTFAGGDPGGSSTDTYMKIYINGLQSTGIVMDQLNAPTAIVIDPAMIGAWGPQMTTGAGTSNAFKGNLADVCVWDSALSAANIKTLYNNGRQIDVRATLPTNLIAWYPMDEFRGNNGTRVANAIGTAGTDAQSTLPRSLQATYRILPGGDAPTPPRMQRFAPGGRSLNIQLNNQNGPYGWPTWKQIRVGERPLARALKKKNYIGQVVPPPNVPNFVRNAQGSMVQVGESPAKSPNYARLYYEPPVDSKMGPVEFYFEDNTEDSDVVNNMRVTIPYGNVLEYFSNDQLNNRLGLTIDIDQPMVYDTVRDFLVESKLSTVVRYTESMYPSTKNMYRARIRTRPNYDTDNFDKIWNPSRTKRSTLGGLTGSFGQTEGKLYLTQTGSNSSIWPLDAHNNFTTTSSVRPWDGAGQLMNSYSRYSSSAGLYNDYDSSPEYESLGTITPAPTYAWRIPIGLVGAAGVTGGANKVHRILAGDAQWSAPTEAGKDPYEKYSSWSQQTKAAMKDGSIIPEFRISEHLREYYDTYSGNFLTDQITGLYRVEGAPAGVSASTSTSNRFFSTYSNSDFMRYFGVIDDSLNDQRSGDLKIERDRIKLSARGLIKFLPYKGFYPAERTAEIATIFSQSYGSRILGGASGMTNRNQAFRIFAEPFMSPGILYNTIKSGLAVGSFVVMNTASYGFGSLPCRQQAYIKSDFNYPEGGLYFRRLLNFGTGSIDSIGYSINKVPFETIQDPSTYFNNQNLIRVGNVNPDFPAGASTFPAGEYQTSTGRIFDTAVYDAGACLPGASAAPTSWAPRRGTHATNLSVPNVNFSLGPQLLFGAIPGPRVSLADPEGGYRYAIDNFLCETTNFFMNGITSLRSNREDQFQTVISGAVYKSTMRIFRSKADADDDSRWDMYSRASAFGTPLASRRLTGTGTAWLPHQQTLPTFSHVLPPYYSGEARVELIYTASYTGKPTVDEILSKLGTRFYRDETMPNYSASLAVPRPGIDPIVPADKTAGRFNDPRMQIDSSFNLQEKISEVAKGTNSQINYWLIQSKFETPILNFANLTQSQPPAAIPGSLWTAQTSPHSLKTIGMWHQYGSPITASSAGVFVEISDTGGGFRSLADVVGFQKGETVRVGDPKKNSVLQEAIVAVPFRVVNDSRDFFPYSGAATDTTNFANLEVAMKKYIFPPKFDFLRTQSALEDAQEALDNATNASVKRQPSPKRLLALQRALNTASTVAASVQPVLMYVFEFTADLNEKDIADMWQNLPPTIEERMQESVVEIEDRELLRFMASSDEQIQWMVFKVKKRAKRDFDIYKRSLVTNDTSALAPKLRGEYTYNWPYDYFSLVELAHIDATTQWTSGDMQYEIENDNQIVLDGNPPPRGTRGAPVVPGPAIPTLPGVLRRKPAKPGRGRKKRPTTKKPPTSRTPRTRTTRTPTTRTPARPSRRPSARPSTRPSQRRSNRPSTRTRTSTRRRGSRRTPSRGRGRY